MKEVEVVCSANNVRIHELRLPVAQSFNARSTGLTMSFIADDVVFEVNELATKNVGGNIGTEFTAAAEKSSEKNKCKNRQRLQTSA